MLKHLPILKNALIFEFSQLYDHHNKDEIYGCALVFNEYMTLNHLTIATKRSLFTEYEDDAQFLSQDDKWNVFKWRFHSNSNTSRLNEVNTLLYEYFQRRHMFGLPLQLQNFEALNNFDTLLNAYKQAIETLITIYQLNCDQVLFFVSMPTQPSIETSSAVFLNGSSQLLQEFLQKKQHHQVIHDPARLKKLTQADKDMLVDIAQIVQLEPYDYMQVANQVHILTLDSTFSDLNPYIQTFVRTLTVMDSAPQFALTREEILARIDHFYSKSIKPR